MRKVDDEFVDDRVCTNGSANRRKTKVGWIDGYEMVGIKTLQLSLAHPSRHGRDVVDVGLRNHSSHRGSRVSCLKLPAAVFFPKCDQIRVRHACSYSPPCKYVQKP
jgi:hypothetical protein